VIPDDPFGQRFLESIARTPANVRRSRLKTIERVLGAAVPQLSQLSDMKDEVGVPHLEVVYKHWRPSGAKQREDQFSDGTLRLVGLFWSLLDGNAPLLLEEPELSLNLGIVRKLAPLMYRMQKHRKRRRQVIVSTHSEHLLSDKGIDLDEVLLLTPDPEGTLVEPAQNIREARDLLAGGLSVADAVMPRTIPQNIGQLDLEY
jgi:predicted ATPase